MVELDIKLTMADLYDYNMKHSFSQPITIFATIIGIVGIAVGAYQSYWPVMALGILIVVYTPLVLLLRSKQAITLNTSLKNPMHLTLDETGLTITQGEASEHCDWDVMVKAISTNRSIILYTSKVNATIIPKNQAGDDRALVIQTISQNMSPAKVKIKC